MRAKNLFNGVECFAKQYNTKVVVYNQICKVDDGLVHNFFIKHSPRYLTDAAYEIVLNKLNIKKTDLYYYEKDGNPLQVKRQKNLVFMLMIIIPLIKNWKLLLN